MKARHAGLFGGALLCAGIGSAQAQEFDWVGAPYSHYNSSGSYALDYSDFDPRDYDYAYGGGVFSTSISNDYGASSAEGTATSFRANGSSTGNAYGFGITFNYHQFRVTQDATVDISWDMTAFDFNFGSHLSIFEVGGGSVFDTGFNTAGSGQASLLAGVNYALESVTGAGTLPGLGATSAFALMTIPAPGSAGLLALAGLAAVRRRR
ncbi:MAG: hypothetical protein H6811_09260 [Phycisphaeraceae bacterium]|nr:hypothetical protein [Phycisphaeraceae bacterium]